jgi:hypothetical protein
MGKVDKLPAGIGGRAVVIVVPRDLILAAGGAHHGLDFALVPFASFDSTDEFVFEVLSKEKLAELVAGFAKKGGE